MHWRRCDKHNWTSSNCAMGAECRGFPLPASTRTSHTEDTALHHLLATTGMPHLACAIIVIGRIIRSFPKVREVVALI